MLRSNLLTLVGLFLCSVSLGSGSVPWSLVFQQRLPRHRAPLEPDAGWYCCGYLQVPNALGCSPRHPVTVTDQDDLLPWASACAQLVLRSPSPKIWPLCCVLQTMCTSPGFCSDSPYLCCLHPEACHRRCDESAHGSTWGSSEFATRWREADDPFSEVGRKD